MRTRLLIRQRLARNLRCISPVIASVLLVAVTVTIAGVVYVMVMGFGLKTVPPTLALTAPALQTTISSEENLWMLSVSSVTRAEPLVNFKVLLFRNETEYARLDTLSGMTKTGIIRFHDLVNDGVLNNGDYFILKCTNGAYNWKFHLIWAQTGEEIICKDWVTSYSTPRYPSQLGKEFYVTAMRWLDIVATEKCRVTASKLSPSGTVLSTVSYTFAGPGEWWRFDADDLATYKIVADYPVMVYSSSLAHHGSDDDFCSLTGTELWIATPSYSTNYGSVFISAYENAKVNIVDFGTGDDTIITNPDLELSGLLACWRFDEGGGNTAADKSGNGYTATLYGPNWYDGKIGKGLRFDGIDDYVDTPWTGRLNSWTITAWVKDDGTQTDYRAIVQTQDPSAGQGDHALYIYPSTSNNVLAFWPYGGGTVSIPSNRWVHVAATCDGTTIRYYVNGAPAGSATPGNIDAFRIIRIGGWGAGDSERFSGWIDEVRIHTRALSAAEIEAYYRAQALALSRGETWEGVHVVEDYQARGEVWCITSDQPVTVVFGVMDNDEYSQIYSPDMKEYFYANIGDDNYVTVVAQEHETALTVEKENGIIPAPAQSGTEIIVYDEQDPATFSGGWGWDGFQASRSAAYFYPCHYGDRYSYAVNGGSEGWTSPLPNNNGYRYFTFAYKKTDPNSNFYVYWYVNGYWHEVNDASGHSYWGWSVPRYWDTRWHTVTVDLNTIEKGSNNEPYSSPWGQLSNFEFGMSGPGTIYFDSAMFTNYVRPATKLDTGEKLKVQLGVAHRKGSVEWTLVHIRADKHIQVINGDPWNWGGTAYTSGDEWQGLGKEYKLYTGEGRYLPIVSTRYTPGSALFADRFDSLNTTAWEYNQYQSVYNLGGENVLKNTGTNSNWDANFYRKASIGAGKSVKFDCMVTATDTAAHFALESTDASGQYLRFCIIFENRPYVQFRDTYIYNWYSPKDLLSSSQFRTNTWYSVMFRIDNEGLLSMEIHEKDNPSNNGFWSHRFATATDLTWRFHSWIWRNTLYLDNYMEFSSSAYNYVRVDMEQPIEPSVNTELGAFVAENCQSGSQVLATDGKYLYVKRWYHPEPYKKIGTGYQGTVRGKYYGQFNGNAYYSTNAFYYRENDGRGYVYNQLWWSPEWLQRWDVSTGNPADNCGGTGDGRYSLGGAKLISRNTGRVWGDWYLLTSDGKYVYNLGFSRVDTANNIIPGPQKSAELYDPASGRWSRAQDMNYKRYAHAAALLPNGKLLVAGGYNGYEGDWTMRYAETYDPATGQWTLIAGMNNARCWLSATTLDTGKVLVVGGWGGVDCAEVYDPAANRWSYTGNMLLRGADDYRVHHTAVKLANGEVLVAGGYRWWGQPGAQKTCLIYNPASNSWQTTGDLNYPRYHASAVLLPNGEVLIAGGYNWRVGPVLPSERWSPATGQWTVVGNITSGGRYEAMSTSQNLIVFPSSQNGLFVTLRGWGVSYPAVGAYADNLQEFKDSFANEPVLATGKLLTVDFAGNGDPLTGRPDQYSLQYSGYLYAPTTGTYTFAIDGDDGVVALVDDVEVASWYGGHGFSGDWSHQGTKFLTAGYHKFETYMQEWYGGDGVRVAWMKPGDTSFSIIPQSNLFYPMIMMAGGWSWSWPNYYTIDLFDPLTNTWQTRAANMCYYRADTPLVYIPSVNRVLAAGGNWWGDRRTEVYDPTSNSWSWTSGHLLIPRYHNTATLLQNGKVLTAGGYSGPLYNGWTIRIFDPRENWKLIRELSTGTSSYSCWGLLADGDYVYPVAWWDSDSAPITRINALNGNIEGQWTLSQGGGRRMITGQYDWVNDRVWFGTGSTWSGWPPLIFEYYGKMRPLWAGYLESEGWTSLNLARDMRVNIYATYSVSVSSYGNCDEAYFAVFPTKQY